MINTISHTQGCRYKNNKHIIVSTKKKVHLKRNYNICELWPIIGIEECSAMWSVHYIAGQNMTVLVFWDMSGMVLKIEQSSGVN